MAALGIVANAFAVVSLSLQVAEAALSVKRFLDTISNVPSDIQNLKDAVLHVLNMADNIQFLGNVEEESSPGAKTTLTSIHASLQVCLNRLQSIEEVLVIAHHLEKGEPLASRTWARFRLVWKQESIRQFEVQLVHATIMLTANLALHSIFVKPGSVAAGSLSHVGRVVGEEPCRSLDRIDLYSESASAMMAMQSKLPAPSAYTTRWFGRQCSLQWCRLRGKKKKYELTLRARMSRSRVIITRLSGPCYGRSLSKALTISVRHRVPADAEIITACKSGDGGRVKHLLGTGLAGPNDMTLANDTPLSMAIKGGFKEVVQLLLDQGADPNITCGRFETSPLQMAVTYEHPDIARLLLTYKADIKYISSRGWSIFHHLFERDRSILNTEYFSIFGDQASFDDEKDLEGWTALHRCAAFGTAEDVRFLHRMGASRFSEKYRTNSGRNPIHIAALMNNISALKALVPFYAALPTTSDGFTSNLRAIHFVDTYGFTPLHHAVYGHAKETVAYLLQHGADPRALVRRTSSWFPENHKGDVLTVEDLARMSGGGEFLGTLEEALQEANYNRRREHVLGGSDEASA